MFHYRLSFHRLFHHRQKLLFLRYLFHQWQELLKFHRLELLELFRQQYSFHRLELLSHQLQELLELLRLFHRREELLECHRLEELSLESFHWPEPAPTHLEELLELFRQLEKLGLLHHRYLFHHRLELLLEFQLFRR